MSTAPPQDTQLQTRFDDLQRRYEQIEDFFDNGAVPLHLVGRDGTILRANKAELRLLGYEADEYVGRNIAEFHADQSVLDDILSRLASGEELMQRPARLRAKDGSIRHVQVTSSVHFENGEFVNTRCFSVDVTQAVLAEERREKDEQQFRQLLDALPAAIYTTDPQGRITYFNDAAIEFAGRRPNIGEEWCVTWRLYTPEGERLPHDQCPMAISLKEGRPVRGAEAIAERPDGTRVPFIPFPTPLRDSAGNVCGAVNMLIDITERKQAEETQRLLIGELNHRVKNTLATVQSLAQQTLRRAKSPEHFVASFSGRIQALAKAHSVLSATTWAGADLTALVREQLLLDTVSEDPRIKLAGPSLTLEPKTVLHLSLVLHELATNARKYGALASPDGAVCVSWTLEHDDGSWLRLRWSEEGAGKILRPATPGFGSLLIERLVKPSGGEARMNFGQYGISWDIRYALDIATGEAQAGKAASVAASSPSLKGQRVLIVEDEPLIAMELSELLVDAGITVASVAGTIAEARRAVKEGGFDAALLDGNLAGEPVDEIAAALAAKGIPFVFVTGYGRESVPVAFRSAPILTKPFTDKQLMSSLGSLLGREGAQIISLRRGE